MKTFAQIISGIIVLIIGIVLFNTEDYISFYEEAELRKVNLEKQVEEVKLIEDLYKESRGSYTNKLSDLIEFYNSNFIFETERDSVTYWGRHITIVDSTYFPVKDSISKLSKTFNITELGRIPKTNNYVTLDFITDSIGQKLLIKAHNNDILYGLSSKHTILYNETLRKEYKYPGIKLEY